MYKIEKINISDYMNDYTELFNNHLEEMHYNKTMDLKVSQYKGLELYGVCFSLGVFYNDTLVGYSVNFKTEHLFLNITTFENHMFYIDKKHRNQFFKLLNETEKLAKQTGATLLVLHSKEDGNLYKILKKKLKKTSDIIFTKEI